MTSQPTEPSHIQQTLLLGAFHVPTSQSLEGVRASRKLQSLVSGSNSSEPYAWYDQSTSSWKTYQRSLLTDWTSFSGTFTRQGTMQNGVVYQAALLELATKEIVGGCSDFLPTPTVCNDSMYYDNSPNKDKRHSKGLATEIIDREMLPTPTTMDHLDQRSPEALKRQMEGPRKGRTSLSNLREAVNPKTQEIFNSLLPTPTATDYKGRSGQGFIDRHGKRRISDVLTQTGDNTYLNPRFVEEMMGYPINWTQVNESKD